MHGVSFADITSDHPLVGNVLPNLSPQLGLDLEVLQWFNIGLLLRIAGQRRSLPLFLHFFPLLGKIGLDVLDRRRRRGCNIIWMGKGILGELGCSCR